MLGAALHAAIQAYEYAHAPFAFKGINYGAAFFMATGFHGFHVLVGTIFLIVCLVRAYKGDFTPQQHFGFEAAAWYWHFVDVVWLFLFVVDLCLGRLGRAGPLMRLTCRRADEPSRGGSRRIACGCPLRAVPAMRRADAVRRAGAVSPPRCRACGLDFARFNVGDGPAAFLTLIVGALRRRAGDLRSS